MPLCACSNRPVERVVAPVKAPFSWPNSSDFDQLARDRRHVDRDEGTAAALAVFMKGARHQFLAGTGLAGDHDRQVGAHQAGQDAVDFLHGRRAADQRQLLFRLGVFGGGMAVERYRLRRAQRALDHVDQFLQVERLGQVFESAPFGRLDGGHQGVLRAHDDDAQFGTDLLDAGDQVQPVLIRHDDVGNDEIALPVGHPAPEGGGISRGADIMAQSDQCLVQHRPDRAIVIGDQDRRCRHYNCSSDCSKSAYIGSDTLNTVRRGSVSKSMTPP